MKNKYFFLAIILLLSSTIFGQKKTYLKANYTYSNFGLKEFYNIELEVLGKESLSTFKRMDSTETSAHMDDTGVGRFTKVVKDSIGKKYYKNLTTKEIVFRDFATKNGNFLPYIVKEDLPAMNWELGSEEKKFGNYTCKKAELKFRGREFEVWYTSEIPTIHGPWKFHGLPGLIVQIESKDTNIKFSLNSIATKNNTSVELKIPSNGKEISFKEYASYKNNSTDELLKKLYAKLPRGARITVNSVTDHNIEKTFE